MKVLKVLGLWSLFQATCQQMDCGGRADIVLVVDSSGSVGTDNYKTTKEFMKNIVGTFTIGPSDVQFGFVRYNGNAHVEFHLHDFHSTDGIHNAIDSTPYTGGGTETGKAIQVMLQQAFTLQNGDRDSAPNIGIVITDGRSTDNVTAIATEAKESGITMFAVGVGNSTNVEELKQIANQPSDYYVFMVENFAGLDNIKDALALKTCNVVTNTPTTNTSHTTRDHSERTTQTSVEQDNTVTSTPGPTSVTTTTTSVTATTTSATATTTSATTTKPPVECRETILYIIAGVLLTIIVIGVGVLSCCGCMGLLVLNCKKGQREKPSV